MKDPLPINDEFDPREEREPPILLDLIRSLAPSARDRFRASLQLELAKYGGPSRVPSAAAWIDTASSCERGSEDEAEALCRAAMYLTIHVARRRALRAAFATALAFTLAWGIAWHAWVPAGGRFVALLITVAYLVAMTVLVVLTRVWPNLASPSTLQADVLDRRKLLMRDIMLHPTERGP